MFHCCVSLQIDCFLNIDFRCLFGYSFCVNVSYTHFIYLPQKCLFFWIDSLFMSTSWNDFTPYQPYQPSYPLLLPFLDYISSIKSQFIPFSFQGPPPYFRTCGLPCVRNPSYPWRTSNCLPSLLPRTFRSIQTLNLSVVKSTKKVYEIKRDTSITILIVDF